MKVLIFSHGGFFYLKTVNENKLHYGKFTVRNEN